MDIFTIPVHNGLENYIRKITVFQSGGHSEFKQKLTPTPYSCLSYNHLDIPDFTVSNKIYSPGNRLQIAGPKTRDDIFAIHRGKLSQVLVEFTATGFFCFFNRSPVNYLNKIHPLEGLHPLGNVQKLKGDLTPTDNPVEHSELLQKFIATANTNNRNKYSYLESAIALIELSNGNISVGNICEQTHISERQLNRKFIEITGLKPIQYIKLKQLHYIINLLHSKQFSSLKELAYETGFYDPAHFNHHFKKLVGMSPGSFLTSEEHIAFKYYNDLVKE